MKKPKQFSPNREVKGATQFNGRAKIDALYDSAKWKAYSKKFLTHNKRCYACGNTSEVTDHIKIHRGDESLFWNETNYIPLCIRCHNTITAKFDNRPIQDLEAKMKWIRRTQYINQIPPAKVIIVPL
jgi:hypothetical protein